MLDFNHAKKPDLDSCNDGEYYSDGSASFEWLIDKLRDNQTFKLKKNEEVQIEDYTFTCVEYELKNKGKNSTLTTVIECGTYNFFIKAIDTYENFNKSNEDILDTKLYWFDENKSDFPHKHPLWLEIKCELRVEDY